VVKRWKVIPDSRKRQKSITEAKYGADMTKAKNNLGAIERENRILQIELELAQMKVDEYQKFMKQYDIKSAKDIQPHLVKIKKRLSTELVKLT
jgi:galactitol-specific phosphotransferase system IIB component